MPTPADRRSFLTAAGLSAGALLAGAVPAGAADTELETMNGKIVSDFCAAWTTRDLTKILPFLADDCVYRMSETTPPVSGHQGVSDRLKQWLADSSLVEFKILDLKASGPIVITHRIDRFLTKQPLTWEGVGVFFVKDGKIKEWSDYTMRVQR
jgi:limonene-1,2-epoxide hydrolase